MMRWWSEGGASPAYGGPDSEYWMLVPPVRGWILDACPANAGLDACPAFAWMDTGCLSRLYGAGYWMSDPWNQ